MDSGPQTVPPAGVEITEDHAVSPQANREEEKGDCEQVLHQESNESGPHVATTPTPDEDASGMLTFIINSPEGDMPEGLAAVNDSLADNPFSSQMSKTDNCI